MFQVVLSIKSYKAPIVQNGLIFFPNSHQSHQYVVLYTYIKTIIYLELLYPTF